MRPEEPIKNVPWHRKSDGRAMGWEVPRMTDIDVIINYPKATITTAMASKVLHCKPESIRLAARERPDLIGFPVIVMGSETKIPRIPFLRFLGYEAKEETNGKPQMESDL